MAKADGQATGAGTGTAGTSDARVGTWALVAVHVLFIAGVGLSTTFVNVYLWRLGGGLGVVLRYHVALFLALIPGGVLGGLIVGRQDRVAALRIGIGLHAVFFLAVLALGTRASVYAWPLGALMGSGMGFYYVAASVMVLDLTGPGAGGAGRVVGAMDQARLAALTVTPFVAAFAIDRLTPTRGYPAVFAASLALFVAAAAYSQRLVARRDRRRLAIGPTLLWPQRRWRVFLVAQGLRGVRDGVFLFLAGILVFERTRSELELGVFAFGSGAVSYVATRLVATRMGGGRRRRIGLLGWGACLSVVAALALALLPGRLGVVAFGPLEAVAVPLVAVPFSAESYALARSDRRGRRLGVGYMVAREVPLNLGRLAGVALLLAVVEGLGRPGGLGAVLIAVALANVAGWLVLRRGLVGPVRALSPAGRPGPRPPRRPSRWRRRGSTPTAARPASRPRR